MKKKYISRVLAAVIAVMLSSCADTERYYEEEDPVVQPTYEEALVQWETELPSSSFVDVTEEIPVDTTETDYDDYIENEGFKETRIVTIEWNGTIVTITNGQEEKGVKVTADGGYVTIENLETEEDADDARGKVTYLLKGTSTNGQLKVYSQKKFQLKLDGLTLTCPDGPAISIQKKKRCFITCEEGTENTLADDETYTSDTNPTGEDEKGCLFSEGQLIFYGTGSLTVYGNHQHAIASDEYIHVHSSCDIRVRTAVKDGIHAKQSYRQTGGLVRSYADKDALQSDSLGISIEGGYLYLCGEKGFNANGGGEVGILDPAKVCDISWGATY